MKPDAGRIQLLSRAAWLIWLVVAIVISIGVARNPDKRTVTPNYRTAAAAYWAGEPMYGDVEDKDGFLYFPQAAIMYTPFTLGPKAVGEVAWRLVAIGVFATGLWRASRLVRPADVVPVFLIGTALSLPILWGNAQNGQANLPMAGLMLHVAVDLVARHWNRATLGLVLLVGLKPLAVVPLLLVGALYPRLWWRLLLGLGALAALPLLKGDAGYALEQYRLCMLKMRSAASPDDGRWQDITGLLRAMNIDVPDAIMTLVRGVAALGTLGVAWVARQRWGDPLGSLAVLTFAAVYICLFNPRTEGLTWSLAIGPVVLFLCTQLLDQRWRAAGLLLVIAVLIDASQTFTGGVNTFLRPIAGLAFLLWLTVAVFDWRPRVVADAPVA
ncbi:MAG: glycosyltransferase 87 family protein [Planctomycetota bacterium]|nr:glycosyltransferase 87 family protein [Planctomycetota bacterium]